MYDHTIEKPLAVQFGNKTLEAIATPSTGSRRRRLWDLAHQCHCPVVGVCLPLDTLRRLVNKALGGRALADDYEVHVGAVAECTHRNRLSELLQSELDTRYFRDIQSFKAAKTTKAVADLWAATANKGDVAGAFWLTQSTDLGVTFGPARRVYGPIALTTNRDMRTWLGDYTGLFSSSGALYTSFADNQDLSSHIRFTRVDLP